MTSIALLISSPVFAQSVPNLADFYRVQGEEQSPPRGSVEIDTSDLAEAEDAVKRLINDRANSIFRELEFLTARDKNDLVVSIVVQRAGTSKHEPNYQANLVATVEGKPVESGQAIVECSLCTEGELINKISESLRTILQSWRDQRMQDSESLPKEDSTSPGFVVNVEEPRSDPNRIANIPPAPDDSQVRSRRRLKGLGWAGIGFGIAGLGATALGGTFLELGIKTVPNDPRKKTNYERPGLPILISGAGVLVSGIVMLIVDRVKTR